MEELIVDCFAGGGGASVGIEMALGRQVDIAINHDPDAILMHQTNHPDTLHLTEDIFQVNLKKYVKGQHVALMWASPDCTSHSKAKGGKPREKGLRILPWAVYKHAKAILPDVIIMENVEEIQQWGPLDEDGYPIKERRGEDYKKFITAMKSLGYMFDCRELVAADYGAPTTRKRWYAIFRRDGKDIVWPKQTHSKNGADGFKSWEPIWKHLDLQDFGKSIFGRKKPLAKNTMNRIARGLEKFVFCNPEPFMVQVNHGGDHFRGQSLHHPLPTITQKHGFGVVTPILTPYMFRNNTGAPGSSVDSPMLTITTGGHHGVVTPVIIPFIDKAFGGNYKGAGSDIKAPVSTITTVDHNRLVTPYFMPFLTKFYKSGTGQSVMEPIHTITTSPGHFGQVSIYAVPLEQLMECLDKSRKEQETVDDVIQKCTWVSQFLMEYYGCGTRQVLQDPLHTIITKDRFALITVMGNQYAIMDIFLRMLNPEELKRGQGFPEDYIIDRDYKWNRYPVAKQVARIGNSVVPIMAKKLVETNCSYLKVGERTPIPIVKMQESGQIAFG